MNYLEKKINELEQYLPPLTKRADFDAFWEQTIKQARQVPLNAVLTDIHYPSPYVTVYELCYHGFDQTPIYGWYLVPTFLKEDSFPCLVNYHGFTGDRGVPSDFMHWVMMGMAVISVDCREQGGKTGNCAHYSNSGLVTNVNSKGILDKNEYYYRAVYMDCLKALDFAQTRKEIDMSRIVIKGVSQGGALGMAICALDDRPKAAFVNVPSNSNIEARIEGRYGSFSSVTDYLKKFPQHLEQAYETLSYFDTMNMADKIKCKVFASVALNDTTCPAKCYFASYNRITSFKHIDVYPFNEHDGAYPVQIEKELRYLKEYHILDKE